jgi:hypothetical protein
MAMTERDRRALQLGATALGLWVILRFAIFPAWDWWQQERAELPLRETALIKYRQAVATVGEDRRTAEALQVRLRETETGLLQGATPALAAAEFQDWARQTMGRHGIEPRSSQFLALRPQPDGYAQVPVALQIQCRLDQLVNFLSELRSGPKIVAVPRMQIQSTGDLEQKLITVNLTVAGVMREPSSSTNPNP